jgi:hypothetical protein
VSATWRGQPERGSASLKRLMIWLALHAGRPFCRVLLLPIGAYFLATAPRARQASREFLTRALGRPATWRDTYRHLLIFATTLLDRIFLLHGRHRELDVTLTNEHAFEDALAAGRGCLLLGTHLGSFSMLGVMGSVERSLPINMVMNVEDGETLRELLAGSDRAMPYKVIPLGQPGSMLRVKECLERGEVVGILADRVHGAEDTQVVSFLGAPARFSLSPFRLARITGAPALMIFGLFHGGRRYEIVFEPLYVAEPASYVAILERHARRTPYNWFNFYDFWSA